MNNIGSKKAFKLVLEDFSPENLKAHSLREFFQDVRSGINELPTSSSATAGAAFAAACVGIPALGVGLVLGHLVRAKMCGGGERSFRQG